MSKGARFKVEYEVVVRDKKGKVLSRQKGVSKSLLRNFMYWLLSKFTMSVGLSYSVTWTAPDVTNTSRSMPYATASMEGKYGHMGGGVNDDARGLVIGTGTTAVTPTDYNLATKIAQGSGAGQMVHGSQTYEAVEVVAMASRFRITRVFTNNSGASITVREIGAIFAEWDTGNVERFFLYLRDVLVSPSTVPDGASLTVRYRFIVTA